MGFPRPVHNIHSYPAQDGELTIPAALLASAPQQAAKSGEDVAYFIWKEFGLTLTQWQVQLLNEFLNDPSRSDVRRD